MKKLRYVPNLISDMAECDANYFRLHRLFPNLRDANCMEFGVQGTTEDGSLVTMSISEWCPYTTMLSIRVESELETPLLKWPRLEVRVYHDLCTAEVVSFERHRNLRYRYPIDNPEMYQPDEKSQINRFLGELLTFCLRHGYSLDKTYSWLP